MEEALVARLLADAGISGIVANRVHLGKLPQGKPVPALVVNVQDAPDFHTYKAADDLKRTRVQIDGWGEKYSDAKRAIRAVRASLAQPFTQGAVRFHGVFAAGERDGGEHVDTRYLHRTTLMLIVNHKPAQEN